MTLEESRDIPMVRFAASEILSKISNSGAAKDGSAFLAGLTPSVRSCQVHLVDGTKVDVYYDVATQFSEIIPQVTWKLGMQSTRNFGMYEVDGERHVMLDKRTLVSFRLSISRKILLMKRETCRLGQLDKINDPATWKLTYVQCRHQYLEGGYPILDAEAVRLCGYLVMAEHGADVLRPHFDFDKTVSENIPPSVISMTLRVSNQYFL